MVKKITELILRRKFNIDDFALSQCFSSEKKKIK